MGARPSDDYSAAAASAGQTKALHDGFATAGLTPVRTSFRAQLHFKLEGVEEAALGVGGAFQPTGFETNKSIPKRWDRNFATS